MTTTTLLVGGLTAVILLLVCSAFFSSSETAIFSLPQDWIRQQADTTGDSRATTLAELSGDPHRLLVTLLVGNNVVNIAISSIMTVLVVSYLPPGLAVVATTLISSFVILVFGEIVPKSFGLGNAERWATTVAPVIRLVEIALFPLIVVFDWITRRMNTLISGESAIEAPYLE
ncbi:hypothetical protein C453_13636 [Haloferax elongans ATCC BAA-1513]|uniref:CNNM transmembrane domain-containing protein n=1 Tax=Haloferax elongans ATCC BAA-1513 TaxID=1230453 RepID=M0HEV3_HALEO|nr:DUF21 domain-containing protein [Haloferax elongans]ELZ83051.1 hypothetical protein C453_13636 [Haloferax elongans ATCC BAA-1513]